MQINIFLYNYVPINMNAILGFTCPGKQKRKKERKKITLKNQGEM